MSVQKPVKTSLPALPASAAPDMRMYLERVREELSRVQGVQNSTTTILRTYGADPTNPTNPLPVGPPGTPVLPCGAPVTPTAPTGFAVTAGFNFFMVEWDLPTYCGHSHTEVYGTKDDGAQGTEVLLGTTGGTIFSLAEPNTGVRRCFWAKHVNLVGVKGPYNSTEGTCDTTALDPGHLIEVLTGQITETQLYKDLGEKIELLPEFNAAITDLNTATGELHEITDELAIGVTHLEEVTATQATTIDGIKVASDNATAAIVQINTVSVDSTSANARQVAGLTASVGTAQADIVAINTVSVDSTSANARHLAGLTVQYNDLNATVVNQGIAFANADQALAQQIDGVEALAQTGPAQRPNMCPNSNFEQDLTGVAYAGCAPYVDAGWSFGRALVANATNSTGCQVVFPQFRANPGDTLNVTFDAQVHNPTGPYVSFLRFYSALGNPFTADRGSVDGTYRSGSCYLSDDPAQRTRFLVCAPVPAGTAYAAFGFYCAGGTQQLILRRPQACGGPLPMPPYSSEAAGSQTAARVINVETARIGYCSKNGETTADGTKEACQANGGTWNVGLPWATAVKQVSVTYNGQTVALQQQFSAISTDTGGLKAQYSVKIDNNGLVSGFGLASEPVIGGGSTSAFGVRADRFWIAAPTDTKNPNPPPTRLPFIVTTTGQTIDGEYFPPGVYVQEAFINAATITTARIKNAAITNAKILNLSADKITAGSIAVGQCIGSTGFVAGSRGWRVCGDGNAEFNNLNVRGNITATGGTIAGVLKIVPEGLSTTDVVELDGPNQRLRVSRRGETRVIVGRAGNGEYGLFVRDNNGIVAMSSFGTMGLNGNDKDGAPIYQTSDFYIDSAYIRKLKTGSINNRAITGTVQNNGSLGTTKAPYSLTTNAVAAATVSYTIAGLPNNEYAECFVVGTVTIYPQAVDGRTYNADVRANGVTLTGASSAVYAANRTAQCLAFTGKATLTNGTHTFETAVKLLSGAAIPVVVSGQIMVMVAKR